MVNVFSNQSDFFHKSSVKTIFFTWMRLKAHPHSMILDDLEVTDLFYKICYRALPGGPLWTLRDAPWLPHLLVWAPLPIGWKLAPPLGTPGRGPLITPPLLPPPLPEFGGGPPLSEDPGLKFLFPPWNGNLSWLGFCNSGFGSLQNRKQVYKQ